jgi:hypothetical protein
MNSRLISALVLYSLGFVLLFASWGLLLYYPPADGGEAMVNWIVATLGALTGHILTLINPEKP